MPTGSAYFPSFCCTRCCCPSTWLIYSAPLAEGAVKSDPTVDLKALLIKRGPEWVNLFRWLRVDNGRSPLVTDCRRHRSRTTTLRLIRYRPSRTKPDWANNGHSSIRTTSRFPKFASQARSWASSTHQGLSDRWRSSRSKLFNRGCSGARCRNNPGGDGVGMIERKLSSQIKGPIHPRKQIRPECPRWIRNHERPPRPGRRSASSRG